MEQKTLKHTRLVELFLLVLPVVASLGFWSTWQSLLADPFGFKGTWWEGSIVVASLILLAVGFLAGVSLIAILTDSLQKRWLFFLICSLTLVLVTPNKTVALLAAAGLFTALTVFAWQIRRVLANQIKFDAASVFAHHLTFLVTIFSIIMGMQYYLASSAQVDQLNPAVPSKYFDQSFQLIKPVLGNLLDQKLDEGLDVAQNKASQQLDQIPQLSNLPAEYQEAIKKGEVPEELQQQLKEQGLTAELENLEQLAQKARQAREQATDTLLEQVKAELTNQVNGLIAQYKEHLPTLLAVMVFVITNLFGFVLGTCSILAVSALVRLLIGLGLVRKKLEDTQVERFEIV